MVSRVTTLFLASCAMLAACERQPAVERQPTQSVQTARTVASADGTRIAFQAAGAGDTALVFIHGWSCDAGYWDKQRPAFARDHRVVTLDLAGHGASGGERTQWSIPAFGEDVAAVIRALPDRRIILVGHSLGGPVALEAARLVPDRVIGIVGVDTFNDFGAPPPDPAMIAKFLGDLRKDLPGTTRSFVGGNFFREDADPALKQRIVEDMASAPPPIAVRSMEALMAYDPKPTLAALDLPIVAINADLHPTDEQAARRVAPTFRLVPIKDSGHFLHMEKPAQFNAALRTEVERIADGGAKPAG